MLKISKTEARRFLLRHQSLYPPRQMEGDDAITAFIQKVGCIQYDPLNRVGRNADLVLQSRCRHYAEQILYDLLYEKRALIDAWDKNMAIMSVCDWPYLERSRRYYKGRYKHRTKEFAPVRREIEEKLAAKGHLNSGHIDQNHKVDWGWAPAQISRATLESMYHCGELIIHHKEGTRKYYALPQKHLPDELLKMRDPNRTEKAYFEWYVARRIRSVGMLWHKSGDAWLGIHGLKKDQRSDAIKRLLKKGIIREVKIDGIETDFYIKEEDIHQLGHSDEHHQAAIIAPLDNLMWDRNLIAQLFDFEYKWEVYTPVSKRKYGYYVLPVLYADKFIARFEPVIDGKAQKMIILNWWWEDDITPDADMICALVSCFTAFMKFVRVHKISFRGNAKKAKLDWIKKCVSFVCEKCGHENML